MVKDANPQEQEDFSWPTESQTVEFRCPDGSANAHLTLAGIAVAARHGLEMEGALELADKLFVEADVPHSGPDGADDLLAALPGSCAESAESLLRDRLIYERDYVFSPLLIDGVVKQLRSYNDRDLFKEQHFKGDEIRQLIQKYLHCA